MEKELQQASLKALSKSLFIDGKFYANNNLNNEINRLKYENAVCKIFNINSLDLKSNSRKRDVVWSRMFIFVMVRTLTNRTFESIGKLYGKDHATIIHALKTHKRLLKTDSNPFGDKLYTTYFYNFCYELDLDVREFNLK